MFHRGRTCAGSSMAESFEDSSVGNKPAVLDVSLDTTPFFSFARDLEYLEEVNGDRDNTGERPDTGDLFGGTEPVEADRFSLFSPTTLADDDVANQQLKKHDSVGEQESFQQVVSHTGFNFDASLNVAFNSANAEQPKQIWETGIWKHIFGDDDTPYSLWRG